MSNNNLRAWVESGDNLNYVLSHRPPQFKPEIRMTMERNYPDPISSMRENIRLAIRETDAHYLRSTPFVFKLHNSWVVTWPVVTWPEVICPVGDLREIKHEMAIFPDWVNAMLVANWMAANG